MNNAKLCSILGIINRKYNYIYGTYETNTIQDCDYWLVILNLKLFYWF